MILMIYMAKKAFKIYAYKQLFLAILDYGRLLRDNFRGRFEKKERQM